MAINRHKRQHLWNLSGGRCWYCGKQTTLDFNYDDRSFSVDHVVPIRHGGTDHIENLRAACFACNASKGAKTVEEFRLHRAAQMWGAPQFTEDQSSWILECYGIDIYAEIQGLAKHVSFWGEREGGR